MNEGPRRDAAYSAAVVQVEDMPADLRWNAPAVWAGPDCHLDHYPLRDAKQFNLVVTFHSREKVPNASTMRWSGCMAGGP